jgi:hypothetical protein
VLITSPFNLTQGSSVVAVIYATNNYTTSNPSNIGSGANITIIILPSVSGTPVTINSGTNIVVTWTAPTIGGPFLNYTIMIGTASGQWATTSYCNGANATVMANLNCTIPTTVLT